MDTELRSGDSTVVTLTWRPGHVAFQQLCLLFVYREVNIIPVFWSVHAEYLPSLDWRSRLPLYTCDENLSCQSFVRIVGNFLSKPLD